LKLNLLPKIVDTTGRAKRAFFGGLLVFAASCVAAFMMVKISGERLQTSKDSVATAQPLYDAAVKTANDADAIMAKPELRQLVVNTALAKQMNAANRIYPDLYDSVIPYIPAFFRITRLSASPIDATTCTVNMTGTVKNAQQYADLMLALLRIKGAISVTRADFQAEDVIVPPLTEVDQNGRPRKESAAPIPDDPLARLAYFQTETVPKGYFDSGNYGNTEAGVTKTVRPGESLITVSVALPRNIQTPNPRETIRTLAGGAPSTTGTNRPVNNPTTPDR
jgi:hypothetical protein